MGEEKGEAAIGAPPPCFSFGRNQIETAARR